MKRRTLNKESLQRKRDSYRQIFTDALSSLNERVSIVLVCPKYGGNIGAVARLMKNYGLSDLRMVSPPEIGDEAIARAMNGKEILFKSTRYETIEKAVSGFKIVAATSSSVTLDDKKFRRLPETPADFWKRVFEDQGKIALVFGREDDGLRNTEIEMCNSFIHIPASPEYPVLNLSHAVAVILYEMMRDVGERVPVMGEPISEKNLKRLIETISEIISMTNYPEYKLRNTSVMISRLLARSSMTQSEYFKIMGILRFLRFAIQADNLDEKTPEKLY